MTHGSTATGARSYLFAPANHARRREKAFDCGADAVILDLEDAVPPAGKAAAREAAAALLGDAGSTAAWVRINGQGSGWWLADLQAVVGPGLAGIVLPKAESVGQLAALDVAIADCERAAGLAEGSVAVMALVETAAGVSRLDVLAAATPRLVRLSFGVADYSLDLGLQPGPDEAEIAYVRARLTHASRAAGLQAPVDSVVVDFRDAVRFRDSAERGRRFGMFGKLCIHPDQVALANEVFAPSAAEVARARAVVEAFVAAEAAGLAAIEVDGEFVDYPVVARARALLALAERLASRGEP